MSKRKGDVGVHNFMVCLPYQALLILNKDSLTTTYHQENNWEPSAVVNWLAIAGRNINNPSLSSLTAVTLPQLIEQVRSVLAYGRSMP